jgi:hypothetical protein
MHSFIHTFDSLSPPISNLFASCLGLVFWSRTSLDHSLKHNDRVETVSEHLQWCLVCDPAQ